MQLSDFSQGLKNEFEKAVVNEPSVFEPLKFYCMQYHTQSIGLPLVLYRVFTRMWTFF